MFNNLKIGTRLGLAFAMCVAVMLALTATAKLGLAHVRDDVELINKDHYVKVRLVTDIKDDVSVVVLSAHKLVIAQTAAEREGDMKTLAAARAHIGETFKKIEAQGGVVPCIESGWFQSEIARASRKFQDEVDSGKRVIVGVNQFVEEGETLEIPVLYMLGSDTRPSARAVARLLTNALPNVELVEFPGLGHMGPVTHPAVVNDVLARFLERSVVTPASFNHSLDRAA